MSRREDIDSAIWDDDEFLDLGDGEKVVYIWSFTNSRIGMAGLYRVSRRSMRNETAKSDDELTAILAVLAERRFCFYEDGVMWVRSRIKHLRTKSPTIAKAIRSDLEKLAGHPLAERLRTEYASASWVFAESTQTPKGPTDTPSMTSTSPIDDLGRGSGQGRAGQGRAEEQSDTSTEDARGSESNAVKRAQDAGFDEWLADHEAVTGDKPPKPGSRGYQHLAEMFNGRIGDGLDLEALKLATRGAFGDKLRREGGHYGCESILRPTKTNDLVNKGRRLAGQAKPQQDSAAVELEAFRQRQKRIRQQDGVA